MPDAGFAKLLFMTAVEVRDPDGADEIQVSRADGVIFEQIRIRKGEGFTFDDDRLLPFKPNQAPIDVVLFEVDENGPDDRKIGSARISASELGLGARTQRIGGAGSLYELTYKVI
jgi:hypothetical protein